MQQTMQQIYAIMGFLLCCFCTHDFTPVKTNCLLAYKPARRTGRLAFARRGHNTQSRTYTQHQPSYMTSAPSSAVTLESLRSSDCTAAITANLSNCTLSQDAIPTQLWGLTSLTYLNLSGNQISCIPSHLGQLISLTSLDLSANAFNDMPAELFQLTSLMDLNVGRNNLSAVSSQLGSLTKMKYLNLMNNSLTDLPAEIGNLRKLYRLGLKSNKLTRVPAIGGMESLVELFITDNHLKSLPDGMSGLHSLVKLQVHFLTLLTFALACI